MRKLAITLSCLTLISCAAVEPHVFGVPESTWNNLSPRQQEHAMAEYYEAQRRKEQQDIINNTFSGFSNLITTLGGVEE